MIIVSVGPEQQDEGTPAVMTEGGCPEEGRLDAVGDPVAQDPPRGATRLAVGLLVVADLIVQEPLDPLWAFQAIEEAPLLLRPAAGHASHPAHPASLAVATTRWYQDGGSAIWGTAS